MRVAIDTHVFVPALNYGGTPAVILDLHTDGAFEICMSPAIIEELKGVLRDRFEWPEDKIEGILEPIIGPGLCPGRPLHRTHFFEQEQIAGGASG